MKRSQKRDSLLYSGEITFNNIDVKVNLKERTKLKNWINDCVKKENLLLGELSFNFCSDAELHSINVTYLNHDYLTDIITFELNEEDYVIGDIYISIERVKENAKDIGISYTAELKRVIIHGVLHLCGYKDKSIKDKKAMRQKEDYYLSLL